MGFWTPIQTLYRSKFQCREMIKGSPHQPKVATSRDHLNSFHSYVTCVRMFARSGDPAAHMPSTTQMSDKLIKEEECAHAADRHDLRDWPKAADMQACKRPQLNCHRLRRQLVQRAIGNL